MLKISPELSTYLEHEFQQMVADSERLERERTEDRKRRQNARKARQRARDKAMEHLEGVKTLLDPGAYLNAKRRILHEYEAPLKKEGTSSQNPLKSKASVDFNNFLLICDHLIRKDNQHVKNAEVCRWIESFLRDRGFKMSNGMSYDLDTIKVRLQALRKDSAYPHILSLIEHSLK